MPLIDTATAKLHLRVDGSAEDSLLAIYLPAADAAAQHYAGRNFYADQTALDAAIAAAPADLTAAVAAYDAAIEAADAMEEGPEQDAAVETAEAALAKAQQAHRMAMRGMVLTAEVQSAVLLLTQAQYVRGDEAANLERAAFSLLDTVRVYG